MDGQSLNFSITGDARSFQTAAKTARDAATALQDRINQATGVAAKGTREWVGALADQSRQIDAMRAKFSPLFAAQQAYLANLKEIRTAHALGALTADEMSAAVAREKVSFAANVVAINSGRKAIDDSTKSLKLNRAGMMELQAAGVNAFQAWASGISLARVAEMEGAQVLGAVMQGTEGLGTKLAALLTPTNLVIASLVAAGAAVVAYGVSGGESVGKLDDIIKAHENNIKLLGDAYDKVTEKQQKYAVISSQTANLLIGADAKKLQASLSAAISNIYNGATEVMLSSTAGALSTETVVKSIFQPFAKALEDLNNSSKDAAALRTFLDTVTSLSAAAPDAAAQLIHMADGANQIAQAMPAAAQQIDDATANFLKLQEAINKIAPGDAKGKLQDLFDDAKNGKTSVDDVTSALQTLENTNLTLAGPIAALEDLFKKAVAAKNALNPQSQLPTLGTVPPIYSGGGKFIDANDVQTARANATKSQFELDQEKSAKGADRAAAAYQQVLKSAQNRIDQMKVELQLTGQVGVAADTLRNYQQLLARATDHGRTIGEAQQKELHARAEEMAKLEEATRGAKLAQDLLFDRQQMFRSPIEQDVYATLRSANIDINSAQGAALAAQIRVNDELKDARQLAGDFVSTFVDGLRQGESGWKAFGDAAMSVLEKIEDKLLDQALNSLFGGLFGGGGLSSIALAAVRGEPAASTLMEAHSMVAVSYPLRGGVVNRPTPFRFANGIGLMGEAGPEGILPLRRNGQGQLGVMASVGNQNEPSTIYAPVYHIDARGADQAAVTRLKGALDDHVKHHAKIVASADRRQQLRKVRP